MKITNENNETLGVYCGYRANQEVVVTGGYAVITFHSDYSIEERGFLFLFTTVPISKYSKQQCCSWHTVVRLDKDKSPVLEN